MLTCHHRSVRVCVIQVCIRWPMVRGKRMAVIGELGAITAHNAFAARHNRGGCGLQSLESHDIRLFIPNNMMPSDAPSMMAYQPILDPFVQFLSTSQLEQRETIAYTLYVLQSLPLLPHEQTPSSTSRPPRFIRSPCAHPVKSISVSTFRLWCVGVTRVHVGCLTWKKNRTTKT